MMRKDNKRKKKRKIKNLKGERNCHANNKEKERHDKISKVASIPWCMAYLGPLTTCSIHQHHQLKKDEKEYVATTVEFIKLQLR
jgi:hypothetical protein